MGLKTESNHTELSFQYMQVNQEPETLLGFLLRKFRYHDREAWLDHIAEGRLFVNQKPGDANHLLKNGQKITYLRPDYLEPEVDPFFEVIYEDEHLIAVNKSGNLPTSPSGKYFKNTLVHVVKDAFGWKKLYTLHRLDRETSGIILFAKQKETAQLMAKQFREYQVKKIYSAILSRPLPFKQMYVSLPIGRDPDSEVRIKQGIVLTGKPSKTHFEELERLGDYAKVEVAPLTGRTHQIRIHVTYLGCPIVGDKLYGLKDDGFVKWLEQGEAYLRSQNFPTHRQLLHASKLCFVHPVSQKEIVIQADDEVLMQHL
ncbi:MAG: RluA family pseudouridine synthase [SAR324 cluster bacterium]|nr:RluA family pseudouridine synthase [SAR324 cluster bacterium]